MADSDSILPLHVPPGNLGDGPGLAAACPACREPLEIQQPDPLLPDRLLGICLHCRAWALIDVDEGGRMYLTGLPMPRGSFPEV